MVGQISDVLIAIAAQLHELERELPATPAAERDRLRAEIEAGEELRKISRKPRETRGCSAWNSQLKKQQQRQSRGQCQRSTWNSRPHPVRGGRGERGTDGAILRPARRRWPMPSFIRLRRKPRGRQTENSPGCKLQHGVALDKSRLSQARAILDWSETKGHAAARGDDHLAHTRRREACRPSPCWTNVGRLYPGRADN